MNRVVPDLKLILEAALLAADEPLSIDRLLNLFDDHQRPSRETLHQALEALAEDCCRRSLELIQVASGWRLQVRSEFTPWVAKLWEIRAGRYSRALLETLALIAYRQPITRGEIEEVRGVSVSSSTIKTLLERGWIKTLGHREVPGRPVLYGTTRGFLDYFNLRTLADLPPLAELRDLDAIGAQLESREIISSDSSTSSEK